MRLRHAKWFYLFLGLLSLVPLLTACPSQDIDDLQPVLTILGETERHIQETSFMLEGQLEDNQHITVFSYRLNGGQTRDVLASLHQHAYRFLVTDLQEGQNTLTLVASDASGNSSQQDLTIYVAPGMFGIWSADASFTTCAKTSGSTLTLNIHEGSSGHVQGTATLELANQSYSGSLSGSSADNVLQGGLSLQNTLGQSMLGQFRFEYKNSTLSGQASFKNAIPCSSSHSEDLELRLHFTQSQ